MDDGTRTPADQYADRPGLRQRRSVRPTGITSNNRSRSLRSTQDLTPRGNWGGRWDSNPRRPGSQPGALPTELRPPKVLAILLHQGGHGAPGRTRTCNRRLRRPMLYPVELRALHITIQILVGADGFEPPTLCSQSRCATRLRHAPTSGFPADPQAPRPRPGGGPMIRAPAPASQCRSGTCADDVVGRTHAGSCGSEHGEIATTASPLRPPALRRRIRFRSRGRESTGAGWTAVDPFLQKTVAVLRANNVLSVDRYSCLSSATFNRPEDVAL